MRGRLLLDESPATIPAISKPVEVVASRSGKLIVSRDGKDIVGR